MPETMLALSGKEMIVAFGMSSIAVGCWKAWCGRIVGFARPVVTCVRSRLMVAIPASGVRDRVSINAPAAIANSSSW